MKLKDMVTIWNEFRGELLQAGKIHDTRRKSFIPKAKEIIVRFCNGELELEHFLKDVQDIKPENLGEKQERIITVWGADSFDGIRSLYVFTKYFAKKELHYLEKCLMDSIVLPKDLEEAKTKINNLENIIRSLKSTITRERVERKDNEKNWRVVKNNIHPEYSIFLLSIFWNMQDYGNCPVYYTSSREIFKMASSNSFVYYKKGKSYGENYLNFCHFIDDLKKLVEAIEKKELTYPIISSELLECVYINREDF